ncbi:MAG: methionine ABC transporter substrate-binding protein, partial [Quinella sp. 3Q1]|nr:methionine ABC transporter substrate-binding protein [Quinella sp. 3Q1]
MKGKFLAAITLAMTLLLAGCGGGDKPAEKPAEKPAAGSETTLKIGATPAPHAEILEQIKPDLKEKGINLEIVEFNDYVQPNIALNDRELDANFFQPEPYLNDF